MCYRCIIQTTVSESFTAVALLLQALYRYTRHLVSVPFLRVSLVLSSLTRGRCSPKRLSGQAELIGIFQHVFEAGPHKVCAAKNKGKTHNVPTATPRKIHNNVNTAKKGLYIQKQRKGKTRRSNNQSPKNTRQSENTTTTTTSNKPGAPLGSSRRRSQGRAS